ncbi:MAG: D-aminoacylase [archaeon YNP-LCB-024-027]|jgi:N-acyl-D-amino-acid deacylase|nr:D-aminoacylase [Candidatus Culexarchaeum yellowstonense]
MMEADILIVGGRVIDGTGGPWYRADIAIKDGKITAIGKIRGVDAKRVIDANGLMVAPGFIDMHSHSDYTLMVDGRALSKIMQGVTTEVIGNCGSSAAPLMGILRDRGDEESKRYGLKIEWTKMREYMSKLEESGVSLNVAPLVGYANIRIAVLGYDAREPSKREIEEMKTILEEALNDGAFGMSTGLRYDPQSFAKTEEIIELAKTVSENGGIYASHIRDEGDRGLVIEAVEEAIRIGREAKVPVEISHLKILAKPLWDKCDEIIRLIDEAREKGVEVTADQYPYEASGTSLMAWIPKWANEGGREKLIERLRDKDLRGKIKVELYKTMEYRGGAENAIISRFEPDPSIEGYSIKQVSEKLGLSEDETAIRLLEKALEAKSGIGIINFNQKPENLRKIFSKPWVMVGSDGYALSPTGILATGIPHPRSYGTFPRAIAKYVKDERVVTLEECIRKMTSLPANVLGLWSKGLIKVGFDADIVIFDYEKIRDTATYMNPAQYPVGIEYVIVNGKLTVDKGVYTGEKAGKVLRKKRRV